MRTALSEKKIVIILFVMVFITFSLAHEDSKKLEQLYTTGNSITTTSLTSLQETIEPEPKENLKAENLTAQH